MTRKPLNPNLIDATLLGIYLASWDEESRKVPGTSTTKSWKGYLYSVLDELHEREFIEYNDDRSELIITLAGKEAATELKKKYFS